MYSSIHRAIDAICYNRTSKGWAAGQLSAGLPCACAERCMHPAPCTLCFLLSGVVLFMFEKNTHTLTHTHTLKQNFNINIVTILQIQPLIYI